MSKKHTCTAGGIPEASPAPTTPEFIRLPSPGSRCPLTGLTRSFINALVLPTEANGNKPNVKSFVIRRKGAKTGVRLISYDSLRKFIHQHAEQASGKGA